MSQSGGFDRFLILCGIGMLLWAVWAYWRTRIFLRRAAEADGVVLEIIWKLGGPQATRAPKFRFDTPDGATWTVDSKIGTSWSSFRVGDRVVVIYAPSNPAKARIDSFMQLWGNVVIAAFGGLIFLIAGLVPLLKAG